MNCGVRTFVFGPAVITLVLGCGREEPPASLAPEPATPAPARAPAPAPPAVTAAPKEPPSDHVDDATFQLRVAPTGAYAVGKVGSFTLTLKPLGEWHLNQDFPTQVSVRGDAPLTFPSAKLGKQSAAEFGEKFARFDVPFTATAPGSHAVTCDVKFAVCSEENCIPEQRTLAVALTVD